MDEKFPAGMRVLVVDDDLTCLMILAAILRKCQYNVTTTNEAIKALQILQENKNEFDLLISDIDMPDMDGFELLQQVGLQMDIPVLSHDDKEWVMKGIAHGACHYLLKPVRIEELKHIWQHVVRRKLDSRQVLKGTQNVDHINDGKPNKKRKDENYKEYDHKMRQQHEDPSTTQKKPRVVWLPELHRKFLAAVNQLGPDHAVPKRILELMNVENITRENVASHLQKYRMYLKKHNSVPSPHANMSAAFGSANSAYHGQLMTAQAGYTSYPVAASVLTSLLDVSSSEIIQWGQADNLNTIDHELHGMSVALRFDNGEQDKDISPIAEFSSINFADTPLQNDIAENDLMLDGHLLNAPQHEFSGNLSTGSLSTLDLSKFDGYTLIPYESFYNEHSPTPCVDLRDNMATSLVNPLPDNRTDLQSQEHLISHVPGNNTNHHPMPGQSIPPWEFSTSSASTSDLDDPLSRQFDNVKQTMMDLEARDRSQ